MRALYLLSVWLHILAVTVWLGGMVFLTLVLVPLTRQPEYREMATPLISWTGRRFRWIGWICLGLILLTGVFNLASRGVGWEVLGNVQFWRGPFGHALGIKLFLVLVILVLSIAHDFFIGPRATALGKEKSPADPEVERVRRQASWIGRLNLVLALIIIALGVVLVRGAPW
ncbi:MAG: DUF4149 domain-containing protein [Nitrospinota bacterium]|nr:MAG: DUF4149 domain-containing protein [Nitrospinota bacterium]